MNLNIDLTVNTPCFNVGADISDSSGEVRYNFQLQEEGSDFELDAKKESERQKLLKKKDKLATGNGLKEALLREGHDASHLLKSMKVNQEMMEAGVMSKMVEIQMGEGAPTGCRFWGSIPLHKVAGTIKITAGKGSVLGPLGAIMGMFGGGMLGGFGMDPMAMMGGPQGSNFSHRVDHFSFGSPTSGILYPLDGEIMIQEKKDTQFNYIIKVVPTTLKTFKIDTTTYQYAMTQHEKVSEKNPGIFIKYDFSGLGVQITEYRESFVSLLTRLAGILGGIFASSGIIASSVGFISSLSNKTPI